MKLLQLAFLLAAGALFLAQTRLVTADYSVVVVVFITPEVESVDLDGDNKVTLGECMASAKSMFPDETPQNLRLIALGCMEFLQNQQQILAEGQQEPTAIQAQTPDNASVDHPLCVDPNGDGIVDAAEYQQNQDAVQAINDHVASNDPSYGETLKNLIDTKHGNGDGIVTPEEIANAVEVMRPDSSPEEQKATADVIALQIQGGSADVLAPTVATGLFSNGEESISVATCLERTGSTDSHPQCVDSDKNGQVQSTEAAQSLVSVVAINELIASRDTEFVSSLTGMCDLDANGVTTPEEIAKQAEEVAPSGSTEELKETIVDVITQLVEGDGSAAPTKVDETTVFPSGESSVPVATCLERTGSTDTHPQCIDSNPKDGKVDKGEFATNTAAFELVVCWVVRFDPTFDEKREAVLNPDGNSVVSNSETKTVVQNIPSADTESEIRNLHEVANTLIRVGDPEIVPHKSTGLFHESETQISVANCLERVGSTNSHSQCIDHNENGFITRTEAELSAKAHQTVTAFVAKSDPLHVAKFMAITDINNDTVISSHELEQIPAPTGVTRAILYSNSTVSLNLFCPIPYGGSYVSQATCNARASGQPVISMDVPILPPLEDIPTPTVNLTTEQDEQNITVPVTGPVSNTTNSEAWHARWILRAKGARDEWITQRALLNKVKEYKKAILAAITLIFVPLYAFGYLTSMNVYIDSIIGTARNLLNFSGKEGRHSYLLWSVTVTALIVLVEAFDLFPKYFPKLDAAEAQNRCKEGAQKTNWAQFFHGNSHLAHALTWVFMTSATVRRMRSTGFSAWVLAPFFLMAISVDINDVVDYVHNPLSCEQVAPAATNYVMNAIKYLAALGYSVTFTAGVAILLFAIPEAEEAIPDESSQVNIVQSHMSESGQYFSVATIPPGVVKTIKMLSMGNERAENVVPAILSFFFHGIGYLFQGRFVKFMFTLAVSGLIWYDFFVMHVVNTTVGEVLEGWADLKPNASGVHNVLYALKAAAEMDHPKISSLYWHFVIFLTIHIASTLDVLSFKRPQAEA